MLFFSEILILLVPPLATPGENPRFCNAFGEGVVGLLGSSWMRTNLYICSWVVSEYKGVDIQAVVNTCIAAGTAYGTIKNIVKAIQAQNSEPKNSEEERNVAARRIKVLMPLTIGAFGIIAALCKKHH